MPESFSIRIFVPAGDPEGVRVIDKLNWTGLGVAFRREDWNFVAQKKYIAKPGVYILFGYAAGDEDLPTIYVGQADDVSNRIESHLTKKLFWESAVAFVSTNAGLNRAHAMWLEFELLRRAHEAGRCRRDNTVMPQEPTLSEAEKADTRAFLREILQILPLVGLRVFEKPIPITPSEESGDSHVKVDSVDTIIVPAQKDGFDQVFLGENCWYAIRIAGGMLSKIKFIAAYQTQLISAITHFAPIRQIEPYGDDGKYKLVFSSPARQVGPIPYADAPSGSMQGPRYTSLLKLQQATKISDLFKKN